MTCAPSENSDKPGHQPSPVSLRPPHEINFGPLVTHWVHSEDPDQTGRMPRLIWVLAGCTGHFVGFAILRFKCLSIYLRWTIKFTNVPKPTNWQVCPAKTQISLHIHVDAQADLSLRWEHRSFCWFCHVQAHFSSMDSDWTELCFRLRGLTPICKSIILLANSSITIA